MLITTLQEEAVNECLRHNIPFVIYALPDCDRARFMASLPDDSGESHAPVEDAAALAGTIQYELLCNVNKRVPRIYTRMPRS